MVLPKANVVFWKSASLWKLIHNCTQKLTRGSCSKLLRAVWDSNYTTTILHCCWVVVEAVYNLCYCCPFIWHTTVQQSSSHYWLLQYFIVAELLWGLLIILSTFLLLVRFTRSFGTLQFNNARHTTATLHCCWVVVGAAYNLVYFFVTCSCYPFIWHTSVQQCLLHIQIAKYNS